MLAIRETGTRVERGVGSENLKKQKKRGVGTKCRCNRSLTPGFNWGGVRERQNLVRWYSGAHPLGAAALSCSGHSGGYVKPNGVDR